METCEGIKQSCVISGLARRRKPVFLDLHYSLFLPNLISGSIVATKLGG